LCSKKFGVKNDLTGTGSPEIIFDNLSRTKHQSTANTPRGVNPIP
jgi:hypothetical protein